MGGVTGGYWQPPYILRCAEPYRRVFCTNLASTISLLSGFFAVFYFFVLVRLLHNRRAQFLEEGSHAGCAISRNDGNIFCDRVCLHAWLRSFIGEIHGSGIRAWWYPVDSTNGLFGLCAPAARAVLAEQCGQRGSHRKESLALSFATPPVIKSFFASLCEEH